MAQERYRTVGALAPQGGWSVELALDRDREPPAPVELAHVPSRIASDGVALAGLLRASELAARVVHPALPPVLGLVERGGGLALASAHVGGVPLPALLAAGGPLPPPLAVHVAGQVARALEAIHGLTGASERPLVHGAVGPEAVRVGRGGEVLLTGLGRSTGGGAAEDVAALGSLLAAAIADPPPDLAAAVVAAAGPEATAGAFWRAIEAAVAPAGPGQLAVWMERMAPELVAEALARHRGFVEALAEEEGPPVDEAAEVPAPADPARTPPPGGTPPPGPPPAGSRAEVVAAPAAASAQQAPPAGREPDWFAPPTAPSTPPPLRAPVSGGAAGPAPSRPATGPRGAPPPLPGARTAEATPAPVPLVGRAPAPPAATPSLLALLGDDRWRAPIVAAAAAIGLILGWLGGR